jgi:hypothetical protein
MITADMMGTYPTKELAAARERFAQAERTVANELPQELSRLPEPYGCRDVGIFLQGGASAAPGTGGRKNGRPVRAVAVPMSRKRAAIAAIGFTDDSHPTILAAARG